MAQFSRPSSDVTVSSFVANGGGSLYLAIDESTASDTDYIYGPNNTADTCEVGMSAITDPNINTGHVVRFRYAKVNAGTLDTAGNAVSVTVDLYQGSTLIATSGALTATGWADASFTLTSGEAATITNYSDLRVRITQSASGGSPANRRGGAVSWVELEVPDVVIGRRRQAIVIV